jgi:MFS family permease
MKNAAVVQNKLFQRLFIARTISNFGNGMGPTATAFAVFALPDGDATLLSLLLTAQAIPLVALLPMGGVIADRFGRARTIATMDTILFLVVIAIATLFYFEIINLWLLVPLYAATGVLNAFWYPAYPGLPADIIDEENLQVANSYIAFGSNIAMILGAAAGGLLVEFLGGPAALAIDGITFLVAGLIVWKLRHTSVKNPNPEHPFKELKDGWSTFWSYKWVVVVVFAFSFIILAVRATEGVLGPLVGRESLGGAIGWSRVVAAESVGLLIGAVIASKWVPKRPIVSGMAITLSAAPFMWALAAPAPLHVIMLAAAFWGIGIETFMIWWITALQTNIPKDSIGRVSAYDAFGSLLFGPIGLAIAGPTAVAFGTGPVLVAGSFIVIAAVLASLLSPSVRNLRSGGSQNQLTDSTSA